MMRYQFFPAFPPLNKPRISFAIMQLLNRMYSGRRYFHRQKHAKTSKAGLPAFHAPVYLNAKDSNHRARQLQLFINSLVKTIEEGGIDRFTR
jgi:hypothetical protein